jgi:tetratricopeptide (TPR) repeat protein
MNGALGEGVLAGLLRDIYVGRRTGVLRLESAGVTRSMRFNEGRLTQASSSRPHERLGESLVRAGYIGETDLEHALALGPSHGIPLGRALVELGVLERSQAERLLSAHVHGIVAQAFGWVDGRYSFEDEPARPPEHAELSPRVATGNMILEALRGISDPDVVRYGLGDLDRILGLSTDPLLRFQPVTLSPADGFVLSRVDGTLSAREVIQLIPLPVEETLRSLLGLLSTGIVEYLPLPPRRPASPSQTALPQGRPAPPRPTSAPGASATAVSVPPVPVAPPPVPVPSQADEQRGREILELYEGLKVRSHYELLGLERGAAESEIKAAYFQLARRFHPDTHHGAAQPELRDKLEAIFIAIGNAYDVLKNPRTRAAYEASLGAREGRVSRPPDDGARAGASADAGNTPPRDPSRQVEQALRDAERHCSTEKYWDAIQALEGVVGIAEGRALARVRLLLAKAQLKNPRWVKRAEETLLDLVRDEPQHVEAHFLLAGIYLAGGLRARAGSQYRKVLELKPDHEEAARRLEELAPPPSETPPTDDEGGGLLRKLFGKRS